MAVVSLLGDSIIDNKTYVKQNEFSVREYLEQNSNHLYTQLAVDGHTTKDVLRFQLNSLPNLATHQVISMGGNDLLNHISFLKSKVELTPKEVMEQAVCKLAPIKHRYRSIVKKLLQQDSNILLCTVYEGNLSSDIFYRDFFCFNGNGFDA